MINKNKIIELANQRINELDNGCYLVDVKISSNNSIFVEIDNLEKGLSIEDCVSVSRNVEHNLDRDSSDFDLQVSSPGIDQPFKVLKQYYKNIGKRVKVVLNDHGSFEGELKKVTDTAITLEWEEKKRIEGKKKKTIIIEEKTISHKEIKETKIIISFK